MGLLAIYLLAALNPCESAHLKLFKAVLTNQPNQLLQIGFNYAGRRSLPLCFVSREISGLTEDFLYDKSIGNNASPFRLKTI